MTNSNTSKEISQNQIIIYEGDGGQLKIEVNFENETVWLTQEQMAELFGKGRSTITEHIQNTFKEGELDEKLACRDSRLTTQHGAIKGKTQEVSVKYYNLDVIISVGYRVKSIQGTKFRQWATARLREYIVKGFTMDDERLKGNGGGQYWKELLDRIRDIRSSEKVLYRQVLDLYATAMDYDPQASESLKFFKIVQNKLHFAAHGHTAAEVIYLRVDCDKPFVGLTNFKGGQPTQAEAMVAKNFLELSELKILNNLVSAYFDLAEINALEQKPMKMADYIHELDNILKSTGRKLLSDAGKISHEKATEKATLEYHKYKAKTLSEVEKDYLEAIKAVEKKLSKKIKSRPAYSLVFAFMLMTVIMILASTTIHNTQSKLIYFRDLEGASKARLAAESAAELAVIATKDEEIGYEPAESEGEKAFTADSSKSYGNFSVLAKAQANTAEGDGLFYTPIPGTGNAAPSEECSMEDLELADHPCNWNKILYDQSITIPLYVSDGLGGTLTPADAAMGFTGWSLRMRTPCSNGSTQSDCNNGDGDTSDDVRYEFDDTMTNPTTSVDGDDTLITWQLVGEDESGGSSTVMPEDGTESVGGSRGVTYIRESTNTEIYESLLNDASDFKILEVNASSTNTDAYDLCVDSTWSKVTFKLSVVHSLEDTSGKSIPYLEWQFISETNTPFSADSKYFTGIGFFEAAAKTFTFSHVFAQGSQESSSIFYSIAN